MKKFSLGFVACLLLLASLGAVSVSSSLQDFINQINDNTNTGAVNKSQINQVLIALDQYYQTDQAYGALLSGLQTTSVDHETRITALEGTSPPPPPPASSAVTLDDFSIARSNGESNPLWEPYLGEDPSQTGSYEKGEYKVSVGNNGLYFHFLPRSMSGYTHPGGYAKSYVQTGTFDPDCNRLRIWIKPSVNVARRSDGGSAFEIGTYARNPANGDANYQGRHFYHILDPNWYAGHWHLVEINRVPQHEVGADPNINWTENPVPEISYMDGLTRFYFDSQVSGFENSDWIFDDAEFDTETGEPDTLVSSIVAVYTGTNYEVTWAGPKNTSQAYDIAYSTTSMLPDNFAGGTSAGTVSNPASAYTGCIWSGPAIPEAPVMYIAIHPQGLPSSTFTEVKLEQR